MPISFACAVTHAPGIRAWPDAVRGEPKDNILGAFAQLADSLAAARLDALVVFTAEHWANFFLDHMSAFCVGRADTFEGPVEPWLRVEKTAIPGDPALAASIIEAAYREGVEPGYSFEMQLDHGTMVPLSFLTPAMNVPVVPIIFNTLAAPHPIARRCLELGRVVGSIAEASEKRIGLVATGGMSHDPGAPRQGWSDVDFDQHFMRELAAGDADALARYSTEELAAAGAGTFELLAWIALGGALNGRKGTILTYDLVAPWGGGAGMMSFEAA